MAKFDFFQQNEYQGTRPTSPITTVEPVISPIGSYIPPTQTNQPLPSIPLPFLNIAGQTRLTNGVLISPNFKSGETGWAIDAEGNVEFNNGTFRGTLTATTGAIGGFNIGTDYLRDAANSFGLASTVTGGDDVRFWAGGTFADRASANLRIYESGNMSIDYGASITFIEGGNIKFTSITAATACTATLIATGTGNVDNGTHKYKITFVNASGETALGTISNTVTVDASNKQVSLTSIPISSSASVTARKIYRTSAGTNFYFLLDTINDNTTTIYTDNIADADITPSGPATFKDDDTFGKVFVNGYESLSLGNLNTFVGQRAGRDVTSGFYNTFLGSNSGVWVTNGNNNTAIGYSSMLYVTTGYDNIAIGVLSLSGFNLTGYLNIGIGSSSLAGTLGGYQNTALGPSSGYNITSGYNNTLIGWNTGRGITTGNSNTILGADVTGLATTLSNNVILADGDGVKRFWCNSAGSILLNGAVNYAADAEASDTYVITLDPALSAYVTGQQIIFKANTANTGAATLNVNGLGAKTIVKAVSTALANNDILASMFCLCVYDGTNFVLMNPRTL